MSQKIRWTGTLSTAEMRDVALARLSEDDVDVVFQPIVEVATGEVFALEALARPRLALFRGPAELIEAAVHSELIGRIGRLLRKVACDLAPNARLFLNVHPTELAARWIVRPDDPIVFHSGELFLEITESAPLEYPDICANVLAEVRSRTGAKIVVDDFGTGHSNIERIAQLEPEMVKLDRQLISGIDLVPRRRIVALHMVAMCHDLGAQVVAEGVETSGELQACIDIGVEYAQGYYLGRPAFPPPVPTWRPAAVAVQQAPAKGIVAGGRSGRDG